MHRSLDQQQLPPSLRSLLSSLRRRIRLYVWAEGLAAMLACLAASFWITLALDWWLEPSAAVRIGMWAVVAAVLAVLFYRLIARRAFRPLRDSSMAVLLERRYGELRESLLTTVELSSNPEQAAGFNDSMLRHTENEALRKAPAIRIGSVLNWRPLLISLTTATVLLLSVGAFSVLASDAFAFWARRTLWLSEQGWPRKSDIWIVGNFNDRTIKVAKGSDLQLLVQADAHKEVIPETVEIRYATAEGSRGREKMSRVGQAARGRDQYQQYTYTFKGILSPLDFELRGGDDRVRDLRIEVVDAPTLTSMVLDCEYPEYMNRARQEIPVSGLVQLPVGTRATLRAASNKPLVEVPVHSLHGDTTELFATVTAESMSTENAFRLPLGTVTEDQTLLFTLLDADGIRSRDPVRLILGALPDEPPKVNARLQAIGQAITPNAILPLAGQVTDDFGLSRLWFQYQLGEEPPAERPILANLQTRDGQTNRLLFDGDSASRLDVQPLELRLGQKLSLAVKAADTFALANDPNIGSSETFQLDVVSSSELMALLEARELMLRRRFETMIEEVTQARDLLTTADFGAAADTKTSNAANGSALPAGAEPEDLLEQKAAASESDSSSADPVQDSAQRRLIQVRRALSGNQHSAQELASMATSFFQIQAELLNNRIDVSEKNTRLLDGIAKPLERIAGEMFTELEDRLRASEKVATDPAAAGKAVASARTQADAILVEMNQVLQQMLKLEDFNQLVELLRGIIDQQAELTRQTSEQHKTKARDLLE